jgi:hypothetical protein
VRRDARESSLMGRTFLPPGSVPHGGVGLFCLSLGITGLLGCSGKFVHGSDISAPGSRAPKEGLGSLAYVLGSLARWDAQESSFVGWAFLPPGLVPSRRGWALLPKS